MSLNIPQFMPILSAGGHETPEQGACVMELASFLAGETWSDKPVCVNRQLARAARMVNDDLSDGDRQRLLDLLPRLMGTTEPGADQAIYDAAAKHVEHLSGHDDPSISITAEQALKYAGRCSGEAILEAEIAVSLAGMDLVDFLSALIDAYDVRVGRTSPAPVTEDDLRRCAELTGASR